MSLNGLFQLLNMTSAPQAAPETAQTAPDGKASAFFGELFASLLGGQSLSSSEQVSEQTAAVDPVIAESPEEGTHQPSMPLEGQDAENDSDQSGDGCCLVFLDVAAEPPTAAVEIPRGGESNSEEEGPKAISFKESAASSTGTPVSASEQGTQTQSPTPQFAVNKAAPQTDAPTQTDAPPQTDAAPLPPAVSKQVREEVGDAQKPAVDQTLVFREPTGRPVANPTPVIGEGVKGAILPQTDLPKAIHQVRVPVVPASAVPASESAAPGQVAPRAGETYAPAPQGMPQTAANVALQGLPAASSDDKAAASKPSDQKAESADGSRGRANKVSSDLPASSYGTLERQGESRQGESDHRSGDREDRAPTDRASENLRAAAQNATGNQNGVRSTTADSSAQRFSDVLATIQPAGLKDGTPATIRSEAPQGLQPQAAAPPDGDDIAAQIVQRARLINQEQGSTLEIQLKPEFLGRVRIETHLSSDNSLTARFLVQDPEVKALLESRLHGLTQALQSSGVRIQSVEVQTMTTGGEHQDAFKQAGQGFDRRGGDHAQAQHARQGSDSADPDNPRRHSSADRWERTLGSGAGSLHWMA